MVTLKINEKSLKQAVKALKSGGIVIYPTDTAYAIGAMYNNPKAVKKINQIKKRRDEKFTLIAASLYQVEQHFRLNPSLKKIARQYWPGPLSVVVSARYAVRVPALSVARKLAQLAGAPLIATSVNFPGKPPAYSSSQVKSFLKNTTIKPDIILDAGSLPKKKASTIISSDNQKINIIRQGPIRL